MAIIHLSGTRLAPHKAKPPLNKLFMYSVGFVFLIAMHIYIPNNGGVGLALPFNALSWAALSLVIAVGFYHLTVQRQIKYTKLTIVLFICCVILTIPLLFPNSAYSGASIPRLIGLWAGWLFFFVLQQFKLSNQHKQRLLWFIVLATLLEALLGYLQFFGLLPLLFGYNQFTTQHFGIFQNPSVMVSFLSTGLVLSGYLLARQQRKYGQKISRTLLLYLMPIITAPLIVLLAHQLEWIGTGLGFLFIATYLYRFATPQRLSGWICLAVSGAGIGLILFSNSVSHLDYSHNELVERTILFPQAIDMFIEKPFTGYGYGRFESEYILYTARQHQLNPSYAPGYSATEHPLNETLFWGIEGGIVAILGIFLAMLMVLFKIYTARKGTSLAMLSLFIPIVLHSQMGMPFSLSVPHWLVFIVLLFWVDQRTSKYRTYALSKMSKFVFRPLSLVLPVLVVGYMALAVQTSYVLHAYHSSFPKQQAILDDALYPKSQEKNYLWYRYNNSLVTSLIKKDKRLVEEYIDWVTMAIKENPRESYYSGLILAYFGLGEISKAHQTQTEARFLFPRHDFEQLYIDPI